MSDLSELFKVLAEGKKHYEENDPKGIKIKQVKNNVKEDLSSLFAQLTELKEGLEKELVIAEAKQEDMIVEDMLTEEIPAQPVIHTPEVKAKQVNSDINKYLTDKSFQQPQPEVVNKDVESIRMKIKFLEQAIGKIAATGPGSGAAEIYNLDMPTKTVTGDYTIGRKDYYIGVNCDVKSYITLPAIGSNVRNGRIVVIKDESGHAQLTPIKIIGTIDNDPNGAEIRINNGAVQLLYSNGQWRIV